MEGGWWAERHWDSLARQDRMHAAVAPDSRSAYVASTAPGTIMVLSLTENRQIDRFDVSGHVSGMVFHPDGRTAYVLTAGEGDGSGHLHVVDAASSSVRTTIPVGRCASSIAISSDGRTLTIAHVSPQDICMSLIDTATLAVSETLTHTEFKLAADGVLARDGGHVYMPLCGLCPGDAGQPAFTLLAVNTLHDDKPDMMELGGVWSHPFDVSADRRQIAFYTKDLEPDARWGITLVDASSGAITKASALAAASNFLDLRFSSDGKWVYVLQALGPDSHVTLFTVDAASGREHRRLALDARAHRMADTPDASRILVMDRSAEAVTVIDTHKNMAVATVKLDMPLAMRAWARVKSDIWTRAHQ